MAHVLLARAIDFVFWKHILRHMWRSHVCENVLPYMCWVPVLSTHVLPRCLTWLTRCDICSAIRADPAYQPLLGCSVRY